MINSNPNLPSEKKRKPLDPATHFQVPEGYFDELKSKVLYRIQSEEEAEIATEGNRIEEKRPLGVILRPYLYLAAMFVGMALIFKTLPLVTGVDQTIENTQVQALTEDEFIRQVSEEEFKQYLLEETQDDYLIATVFD